MHGTQNRAIKQTQRSLTVGRFIANDNSQNQLKRKT